MTDILLDKAIQLIEQIQWSHCGQECAACGGSPSNYGVNGGHEDDCPIVLFFEELGLPKSRLYRPEEPEREYTGPPLTLEEVDTILKAYTKKLKLQSASAILHYYGVRQE